MSTRMNFEIRGRDFGGNVPSMRVPGRAPVPSLGVLIGDVLARSQSEFYGAGKSLIEVTKVESPGVTSVEAESRLDAPHQIDSSE